MRRIAATLAALLLVAPAWALDHTHAAWDALLRSHVRVLEGDNASRVEYAGMAADRPRLKAVLDQYRKVGRGEFDAWTRAQQQAFLINAYNAFTLEKVLTRYPDLRSIRDFGSVFGNPWKDRFFSLLGEPASLDQVEHGMLRREGAYDWYRGDFEKGHKGYSSVRQAMARHADLLADAPADRAVVRAQAAEVTFLEYDWRLNDVGR